MVVFEEYAMAIVSRSEYAKIAEEHLSDLLEEYGLSEKEIQGTIFRARLESPLDHEAVRAFCKRQLNRRDLEDST
ncbi:MAG: hypothetical protein ACXADX_18490 [Candidatus Hodarchaeales archaeon]